MKTTASISIALVLTTLSLTCSPVNAQQDKTHLGGRPNDMVTLFAIAFPGTSVPLEQYGPDGSFGGNFVLPPKTVLVVTDVIASVDLRGSPGQTRGGLINQSQNGGVRPYFSFDTSQQGSQSIHLTSGVVWTQAPLVNNATDSSSGVFVQVYGYLVKNQ